MPFINPNLPQISGPHLSSLCVWALGDSALSRDCVLIPALRCYLLLYQAFVSYSLATCSFSCYFLLLLLPTQSDLPVSPV